MLQSGQSGSAKAAACGIDLAWEDLAWEGSAWEGLALELGMAGAQFWI